MKYLIAAVMVSGLLSGCGKSGTASKEQGGDDKFAKHTVFEGEHDFVKSINEQTSPATPAPEPAKADDAPAAEAAPETEPAKEEAAPAEEEKSEPECIEYQGKTYCEKEPGADK